MEVDISAIVLASIGWTLVLTVAVIAAVFAVNSQFSAIDRKIDVLQNLILQHVIQRPENKGAE